MKCVAIDQNFNNHLLDHISVMCYIMKMPLIVSEKEKLAVIRRYYPKVKALFFDYRDLSDDFLARNYDVFFQSVLWQNNAIDVFAELYGKKARFVYCPHGNSDKGYKLQMMKMIENQDIVLLYGEHMQERLKGQNLRVKNGIITGNFRYAFYKQNRAFYDNLVEEDVFSKLDSKNKTILYAPTWNDGESNSSFFQHAEALSHLPDHYNLIVKLHPLLEEDPALFFRALSFFENKKNIFILKNYPLIYPLLAKSDIYVGDFSSVGYDFLAFQKPMFFFSDLEKNDPSGLLHNVGQLLPKEKIYEFIDSSICDFTSHQKELYAFAFGEEKPFAKIRSEIISLAKV